MPRLVHLGIYSEEGTIVRYRMVVTAGTHRLRQWLDLPLASGGTWTANGQYTRGITAADVDLLFANEEEICCLALVDDVTEACRRVRRAGLTLTVTQGAAGALVWGADDAAPVHVAAQPVERVVDTTGAGDLYAAGFLWGHTSGFEPDRCARLGGITAAEIISHVGARPEADLVALVSGSQAG